MKEENLRELNELAQEYFVENRRNNTEYDADNNKYSIEEFLLWLADKKEKDD